MPTPAATNAAGVIPWADLPAADTTRSQPPPEAAAPMARLCRPSDLAATAEQAERGGGRTFQVLRLRNRSTTACLLDGRISGLTGFQGGFRREIAVGRFSKDSFGVQPVVLEPGSSGETDLDWFARCDVPGQRVTGTFQDVRVRVLGGVLTVPGWILDLGCGPVKDGVVATRLGARPPEPATDPISSLTASLSVPSSVAAGTMLRYTVTLAPRGTADVVLQPCPNFLQALGTGLKDPHRLNCAGARPVTAVGGETFAMQLVVPATTAPDQMTVTWFLGLPGGASAAAPLSVTAAAPDPCAGPGSCPGSAAPP